MSPEIRIAGTPAIQRDTAGPAVTAFPVPGPAAPARSVTTTPETTTRTTRPAGASAPAGSPPSGRAAPPQAELDVLAHRLLDPLSRLLRAELRADRERLGRLRDPL
ncbi:hypothetical protein Aph02nite_77200 [Actinoplanes philippinensis]|uniref:hypothetical protein n=1 Tax=Actinoplanes philippinensis TaxID=35752 RepID=UPI000B89B41E|nr:hypothetical protein [Actinoplanes philippinensis]GIE81770.1 hypothetical protein Aph02nite_77200 [Actinoplanes philippinensis]